MTLPSWRSSTVMTFLLREMPRGRTTQSALWLWLEGLNSNKPDLMAHFSMSDCTRCSSRASQSRLFNCNYFRHMIIVIAFLFPASSNLIRFTSSIPGLLLAGEGPVIAGAYRSVPITAVKLRKNSTTISCAWKSRPHLLSFAPRSRDPLRTLLTADNSRNGLDPRSEDNSDAQ